jgi:hypothetical protein
MRIRGILRNRIGGVVSILVGAGIMANGFRQGWTVGRANFIAHLLVGLIFFLTGLYYLMTGQDRD